MGNSKTLIRICPPIWYEEPSGSWTIECDLLLDIKVRYFIIIFVWLSICQLLWNIIAHSKAIFSPDPWWPGLELNKTARKKPQYWTARIDDDDDIFSYKATCLFLITLQQCDLLHKIKVIPLTYVYMVINYKGALLNESTKAAIINRLKSPDFGVLNVDRYANVNAQYQLNIPYAHVPWFKNL